MYRTKLLCPKRSIALLLFLTKTLAFCDYGFAREPLHPVIKTNSKKIKKASGKYQVATIVFTPQNVNTSSPAKTFTIRGSHLKDDITVITNQPFEISKDSIHYSSSATYSTDELASSKPVYVKFKPTAAGDFSASVLNMSVGAESEVVVLKGTGIDANNDLSSPQLSASNILTPNGDGRNDIWIVKNIEQYPDNLVSIFDKSGRIIFQKHGYTNDWNGTYNNAPLNQGTYYYTVTIGTNSASIKGFITVVRD